MKDLLICLAATTWVLEIIYCMGRRRHPRKGPDQIDRDFRDLVKRANQSVTPKPSFWFAKWGP